VSTRLVDRIARPLARKPATSRAATGAGGSRRDLFRKAALTGTALAVAPKDFVLRPVSAYAAVCSCNGQSCDCGSLCCSGYTEFCCTTTGTNWCPPGAVTGGWWKVDNSHFCGGNAPRYYLDCHNTCGGCGCSGGICSNECASTRCGCAGGSCNNRKSGCTRFRYGQCNAHIACLGPIICRVVSCTPPWQLDRACSTAALTDNNTRYHHRPCLDPPPPPPPPPEPKGLFMALSDAEQKEILDFVRYMKNGSRPYGIRPLMNGVQEIQASLDGTELRHRPPSIRSVVRSQNQKTRQLIRDLFRR
jgi:hypothetical protein